jgi:4-amino-4-deoxy-L-arabinose transferase-like glycosyltransferase
MVVPGIVAAYAWVAPRGRRAAAGQLALGGAAMTVVGLAWPVLMWLTPAASRPWISGTSDNSIWSLILGYNGLGRLLGQSGGPNAIGGMGGGGGMFGGSTGVTRLLNASIGGQAGWFLGFAVVALIALAVATRGRRGDARTGWAIAVGGAFAVTAVAFSRAQGIFHPYYVSLLAPFTAALAGAGWALFTDRSRLAQLAAPAAVVAGALVEWQVLRNAGGAPTWLAPALVVVSLAAAVLLLADAWPRLRRPLVTAMVGLLLLAPASWSLQTLGHAASGTFPAGGAATASIGGPGGGAMFGGTGSALTEAIAYADANGGGTIGVSSQSTAAAVVLADGSAAVVGLGGFSGRESEVTVSWLADAVASGQVRYVLVTSEGGGMGQDGRTGATTALAAAAQAGTPVSSVDGLYDLQGKAAALRALA